MRIVYKRLHFHQVRGHTAVESLCCTVWHFILLTFLLRFFFAPTQVKEQMRVLKKLYQAVANSPAPAAESQIPTDLTAEKMVTVVTAFFEASNSVIRSVVEELLAQVT